MHMIERLKQATAICEEADRFALLNQNPKRFGELDQLVCDAGNQYLYVCAYWVKNGRPSSSSASTHKHGLMKAVKMAMRRREAGSGRAIGLTAIEVVERLQIEVRE